MGSLKLSTSVEVCHTRYYNSTWIFMPSDQNLIFPSPTVVYNKNVASYNLWLPNVSISSILDKRKTGSNTDALHYGFRKGCEADLPFKSSIYSPQPSLLNRDKTVRVSELERSSVSNCSSDFSDDYGLNLDDQSIKSLQDSFIDQSLILKNIDDSIMDHQNHEYPNDIFSIRKMLLKILPKSEIYRRKRYGSRQKKQSLTPKTNNSNSLLNDKELSSFVHAIEAGSSVVRCNSILERLERNNEEKSLSFFKWMKTNGKLKQNTKAYNLALRVLSRKEKWHEVEKLLEEMTEISNCELNCQVFNSLIYVCSKKGIGGYGTRWFHMMLDKGVQPNLATFGMLMTLYQKCMNLSEAEFTFQKMRSLNIKCHTAYSSMITIYTRLALYDKAEDIIEIMKEDGVAPNFENWLVQLNAYSQQGKLDQAELVLKLMQEGGISPNIVAYNTLITGYGKVGNTSSLFRLFLNLQKLGLKPDETTYRSMIEGFGRAGKYREARWCYKELKKSGFSPNSSNFYTMINLQAKHKDAVGTIETLNDMKKMGCSYTSILSSLLYACERKGNLNQVPSILNATFYQNILFDQMSCSILVLSYVQHNLIDEALQILKDKRWEDAIFEDNLYHLLICSCKEMGRTGEAVKIFLNMPNCDLKPNIHITCTMIDIYTTMGQFFNAENLYLRLKSTETKLDMVAYSIVVRMYMKFGSLKDACIVLDAMEKQKNIIPDTFLYRDMLRIYQKCGMFEKLKDIYYKILSSKIQWDEEMYNCVINCCARVLPVDEISRLFGEMCQLGFKPNVITYNVILDVYGKAGFLKKVRKVFWIAQKDHAVDVVSFNTIIAAYGLHKDYKNMRSVAQKMKYFGYPISLEAYNCMLDSYGKGKRLDAFNNVLQKMKEERYTFDLCTYNTLINIYGKNGLIEDVNNVLQELKQSGLTPDIWSYNTLIKAYGVTGMIEEAVSLMKKMRENGVQPDRITYVSLITALQRNDNFLEAIKWSLWMKQIGI